MERKKMILKEAAKRLAVMLLAIVMTLSMTGYSFVEAFAEDGEEPAVTEESSVGESAEETDSTETVTPEEPADAVDPSDTVTPEEPADAVDPSDTVTPEEPADAVDPSDTVTPEEPADDGAVTETEATEEKKQEESEPAEEQTEKSDKSLEEVPEETVQSQAMEAVKLAAIKVRASKDESLVSVFWTKVNNAAYYMIYLNDNTTGVRVAATEDKYILNTGNVNSSVRKVRVAAYRTKATTASTNTQNTAAASPQYEKFAEGSTADINVIKRRKLASNSTQLAYLGLSLREMIGEGHDGYSVTQGAATDGQYAYYMMTSSLNQKGRVLRVNLANPADYAAGPVLDIHHANGMTYDSKRKLLVAVGFGAWRHQLSFIDPNSLGLVSQRELSYPYNIAGLSSEGKHNGIAAIAYIRKYNVYLARMRGRNDGVGDAYLNNDIMVINADNLYVIGHIFVHVTGQYPGTYQSMDADEKYVYYLLSPGSGQGNNIILCLDWDSENLLPVLRGEKQYVEYTWKVNNNDSGEPDAVMTIPIGQEAEGLFHTNDASGNEHFYVTEYYGRWHYKTVTKTVKYKKKWKKVRKWYNKKTKKWTRKKPKKKYRGKSKKVWKYKTKKKKKKVTVRDYWARDNYVYYIGSF